MFSNMRIEDQKRQSKIQHCCVAFSPVVTRALRSEFNDPTSFPFDNRSTNMSPKAPHATFGQSGRGTNPTAFAREAAWLSKA